MTAQDARPADERAVERYRYMLRTAPPETIEQAHEEAFARLTTEQRQQVLQGLSGVMPETERSTSDDPTSLARMATRAEMRQPGTLERTFGGMGGGAGMGMGGMFLTMMAASFVGTAIAQSFFGDQGFGSDAGGAAADDAGTADASTADPGASSEGVGEGAGSEGDLGGGDFGGGDLGGGDFGGGDFGGF